MAHQILTIVHSPYGQILAGHLPPKARALTEEWRIINTEALLENWQLMIEYKKLKLIKGLA